MNPVAPQRRLLPVGVAAPVPAGSTFREGR